MQLRIRQIFQLGVILTRQRREVNEIRQEIRKAALRSLDGLRCTANCTRRNRLSRNELRPIGNEAEVAPLPTRSCFGKQRLLP